MTSNKKNPFDEDEDGKSNSDREQGYSSETDLDLDLRRPPLRIDPQYEDSEDEYERRTQPQNFTVFPGTYLFSVGPVGSGKSTFQSQLMRYFVQSKKFSIDPIWTQDPLSLDAEVLFKSWRDDWENDAFPQATQIRNPAVLRFRVKAQGFHIKPVTLGIIEVSGEDYNRLVDPNYGDDRKLPDILEAYLSHPDVKLIFSFVCKGGDPRGADRLFSSIINRLMSRNPKFVQNSHSLIVVSDPHTAKIFMHKQGIGPASGKFQLDSYIDNFLPDSSTKLLDWKQRARSGQFYIGRLRQDNTIVAYDNEDVESFATWIFETVSKKRLQPPLWKRLIQELGDDAT